MFETGTAQKGPSVMEQKKHLATMSSSSSFTVAEQVNQENNPTPPGLLK